MLPKLEAFDYLTKILPIAEKEQDPQQKSKMLCEVYLTQAHKDKVLGKSAFVEWTDKAEEVLDGMAQANWDPLFVEQMRHRIDS
jgi:hypothetical protein